MYCRRSNWRVAVERDSYFGYRWEEAEARTKTVWSESQERCKGISGTPKTSGPGGQKEGQGGKYPYFR